MKYYVKEFDTANELVDHLNKIPRIMTKNTGDNLIPAYITTQYGIRRKYITETVENGIVMEDVYYAIGQSWEDEALRSIF